MPSDFTGFWVNSLDIVNMISELHPQFIIIFALSWIPYLFWSLIECICDLILRHYSAWWFELADMQWWGIWLRCFACMELMKVKRCLLSQACCSLNEDTTDFWLVVPWVSIGFFLCLLLIPMSFTFNFNVIHIVCMYATHWNCDSMQFLPHWITHLQYPSIFCSD